MKWNKILLSVVLVLQSQAQESSMVLEQRVTDYLRKQSSLQLISATRYVPVILTRGLGTWAAPRNVFLIDDIPFTSFPLNLLSPDYAPIDLILAESVEIHEHPVLGRAGVFPEGQVSLRRASMPDSLLITGRFYGGSETGDVILQEYTKDNLPFYNRNKIGFSGAMAISDRVGGLAYRLMAGGFSYFSVGYADRDPIIIPYIDLATFSEPNRNYVGSIELEYDAGQNRTVGIHAGVNSFHGWEQAPFLPTFAYFTGSLGTIRLSASELFSGVHVSARHEFVRLSMRQQLGTPPGEYTGTMSGLNVLFHFPFNERVSLQIPADVGFHAIDVPPQNAQLFIQDIRRTTWSVGLRGNLELDDWSLEAHTRYEKGLNTSFQRSGEIIIRRRLGLGRNLVARAMRLETSPSLLELYGNFSTWRYRPVLAQYDTFSITGSASLRTATATGVELSYSKEGSDEFRATVFATLAENLIDRRPLSITRSSNPGDLVFSGIYFNQPRRSMGGAEIETAVDLSSRLQLRARYTFFQNIRAPEFPRHQLMLGNSFRVSDYTVVEVSVTGTGKTIWPEFAVDPAQDDRDGVGSDGGIPEYWLADCSLRQQLGKLFFVTEAEVRIELQNILNREVRQSPIGITKEFTVIGFLSVRF